MSLYDQNGQRKYLTPTERDLFLQAADEAEREVRTLCGTLVHTGCRISEALALSADRVDLKAGVVIIESLKKRRRGIYRAVRVPPVFLDTLNMVHDLRAAQRRSDRGKAVRLWDMARNTAWRNICDVMKGAKIAGPHATPKGLRHAFGIKAATSGVPLNMLQKMARPCPPFNDIDICRRARGRSAPACRTNVDLAEQIPIKDWNDQTIRG